MKRLLTRCLLSVAALATISFSAAPAFATGATLSLSPSTGTFNKGCGFTLSINLDTGGAQTDGTDAILFYDPTRFTANAIHSGTIYADYPGNNIDATNGKITVSGLSSVSSAFSGAGTLATIDFAVADDAPAGTSQIKFDFDPADKTKTTDSNVVERGTVTDILNQVVDGNYTIGTGACGTTNSGTTTTTTNNTATGSGVWTKTPVGGPLPTKTPVLPQSGNISPTVLVAVVGSALTILGILGLAIL